jgi:NAD(P)-dependent dehydrogenase (short-subunit alcohol dehydrogenase family)
LTQTAALEYATQNIRVNVVCPGFIYTPLLEQAGMQAGTEMHSRSSDRHPMKRMARLKKSPARWFGSFARCRDLRNRSRLDGRRGYTAQ